MTGIRRLHAVTILLAAIMCCSPAPTTAAEITTRALPGVQSEATVASCGNRVVILSQSRGFLSVTRDGAIQPLTGVDHA
ncbi:MAG TPA: hypothetical protein VFE35_03480, partial [Candidatus Cybelea sp.]|nr:hypothetical protein [Candidatus Cybelea sp.]